MKAVDVEARIQPAPPPAHRAPAHQSLAAERADRGPCQKQDQDHLLHGPPIPAARCHTLGQPRTSRPAARAVEARNRHRIERLHSLASPVGLAHVAPVAPRPRLATVRTTLEAVTLALACQRLLMLLKGRNSWHDTKHRPGAPVIVVCVATSHDNRGAPAFLLSLLCRNLRGNIPGSTLMDVGIYQPRMPTEGKDVTPLSRMTTA